MGHGQQRVCPVEQAGMLDNGIRKLFHSPYKILGRYIKEGMTVLDYGCGPGFFSISIAEMVGISGQVVAADLQDAMLQRLRTKIEGTEIEKRIKLHRCQEDSIGITKKVDFVLAFYMFHEVPRQDSILREMHSILQPDGRLFIIEPMFHVSQKAFEDLINNAKSIGFGIMARPKVFLSRAIILGTP